jgi:hypothetical protein
MAKHHTEKQMKKIRAFRRKREVEKQTPEKEPVSMFAERLQRAIRVSWPPVATKPLSPL